MVKVSVIIPIHNGEKFLERCLKSVAAQSLNDIEIICVNDGSTDNTEAILKDFASKDKRIKITSPPKRGLSIARNFGISEASGEYIGFVDCDDYIDPDYYEKLYSTAVKYNAEVAVASVFRIRKKRNRYFLKFNKEIVYEQTEEKYKIANLPQSCYVWNKIYKREAYLNSNIEFTEGIYYEDIEFNHKVLHQLGKLVTVPGTKYYYYDNPTSVVNVIKAEDSNDYKFAMSSVIKYINENNIKYDLFRYPPKNKYTSKILGLPILKTKEWDYGKKIYLFGIILIKKTV